MFKLQQVNGRKRTFASSENYHHTMATNSTISKVGGRDEQYALVRLSYSVQGQYGITIGCSDCKKLRPASARLEISLPQDIDSGDLEKFKSEVVRAVINAAVKDSEQGALRGFMPSSTEYDSSVSSL